MGGRGSRSFTPKGRGSGATQKVWTSNLGGQVPPSLKAAIGTKGSPFTITDSIVKTNPHWDPGTSEFSMNCQRCVVAYELRRRGYDVTALPTFKNDKLPKVAYYKNNVFEGRWKGAFRDAKTLNVGARTESGVINNIESKMRSFGQGSRAVIQIFYKSGGGHVFNVENDHGRIVYAEAQVGGKLGRYGLKNIQDTMSKVETTTVNLVRTDNLRLSDRARNFVKKA